MESGRDAVKMAERTAEAAKTTADSLERSEKAIKNITKPFFQSTLGASTVTIATKGSIIKSVPPVVKGTIIVAAASYGYISTSK